MFSLQVMINEEFVFPPSQVETDLQCSAPADRIRDNKGTHIYHPILHSKNFLLLVLFVYLFYIENFISFYLFVGL